ncbi:hypothetical protein PLICRDRAFT_56261 [Plicaturopsis crispa FD-325 SS-3]|nr:hypothetical protein PLICRDRAFT_56261 [Plicaturopsis crispa FD-325 SS-3]
MAENKKGHSSKTLWDWETSKAVGKLERNRDPLSLSQIAPDGGCRIPIVAVHFLLLFDSATWTSSAACVGNRFGPVCGRAPAMDWLKHSRESVEILCVTRFREIAALHGRLDTGARSILDHRELYALPL